MDCEEFRRSCAENPLTEAGWMEIFVHLAECDSCPQWMQDESDRRDIAAGPDRLAAFQRVLDFYGSPEGQERIRRLQERIRANRKNKPA